MKIKLPKRPPVRFMCGQDGKTAFPVFKCVALPQWKQWGFRCPICGKENCHGEKEGHRVGGCNCWVSGYYIELEVK